LKTKKRKTTFKQKKEPTNKPWTTQRLKKEENKQEVKTCW